MKIRQLKVKIKSLAAEQRIIKHEEVKARRSDIWLWRQDKGEALYAPSYEVATQERSLQFHRRHEVRPELRSTNIAYGLIRGRTLEQIETPRSAKSLARKPYREPDWKRIADLTKKYGNMILDRQRKAA